MMPGTLSLFINGNLVTSRTYPSKDARGVLFNKWAVEYDLQETQWLNHVHFVDRPLKLFRKRSHRLFPVDEDNIRRLYRPRSTDYGMAALADRYKVNEKTIAKIIRAK